MPEQNRFAQWSGCAAYNHTIYRVVVVAPKDAFQGDVCRAVSTAGGFNSKVERDHPDKALIQVPSEGTKFIVAFIPDKRYTADFATRKPVMVLLSASNKKLHDGEFQKAVAFAHMRPSRVYCPTCLKPGYPGSICKQCSRMLYLRC